MPNKSNRRSLAEKVSFSISLFIVTLLFALVCFTWISGDSNPPILSVITDSNIRQVDQQYYLPFSVINSGGETVESVEIVAKLSFNNDNNETGRQQINFLSRQEKRSGEFIFSQDPQQGELIVRVASYKLP